MESNQWDDGEAGDPDAHHHRDFEPLPPAPLPAHERTWRHPSELGANTVEVAPAAQPAISRRATVATVAAGVLLVVGAVRLMAPASSSTITADGATVLTVEASVSDDDRQVTSLITEAPRSSFTAAATFLASTTVVSHHSASVPAPNDPDDLTVGDDPTAYAVVLGEGRFLATTASVVADLEAIEVHLPTGDTVTAAVVRSEGPIVLLDLSGVSTPSAPHGDTPDPGELVTVGAPDGHPAMVGEPNEHGFALLVSDRPLHDSGPVYDRHGELVGICARGADQRDWLVPVGLLDEMAADHDAEVAPTSPPANDEAPPTDPTTIAAASTTSTAATTTTTVTTTTVATTSTTKPPATTKPATTVAPTPATTLVATTVG